MRFNLLLSDQGIDPAQVAMILHTPKERELRRWLASLVVDAPELFNAYQNNHKERVEATLKVRKYMASFVDDGAGAILFVGLYAINAWEDRTAAELDADPANRALQARFGTKNFAKAAVAEGRATWSIFDFAPLAALADLRGRVVIDYRPTQMYVRLAENLDPEILEVRRQARFAPPAPDWRDFIVTAEELKNLHQGWAQALLHWRGVYLIVGERDGERYVGSAYGEQNLLGRWQAHVAREKGVTAELGLRDTSLFRFSILQLLLHDATADEVIAAENTWKDRLHTRKWGLNKN